MNPPVSPTIPPTNFSPAWSDLPLPIQIHIAAALLALAAGLAIFALRRGTPRHRAVGRVYLVAMLVVAIGSFWIRTSGGLSWIHGLSAFTIFALCVAWFTIRGNGRVGRIATHASFMIGTFGGLAIAGAFTLLPERILGRWLLAAVSVQ